jgi:hypothetical protein
MGFNSAFKGLIYSSREKAQVECENSSLGTIIWGMFTQKRFFFLDMSILGAAATEKKRYCFKKWSCWKKSLIGGIFGD